MTEKRKSHTYTHTHEFKLLIKSQNLVSFLKEMKQHELHNFQADLEINYF